MTARTALGWSAVAALALAGSAFSAAAPPRTQVQTNALASALTFHASFDGSTDAAYAAGDPRLYSAPSSARRQEATPGLPETGEIEHARSQGRFGDALRFTVRRKPLVFFKAGANVPYTTEDWSGTVSFWLSVDPATDLAPGFCDPVQITPRAWNDAAFFVEFEKGPDAIPFRLGAYADLDVWNPTGRRFEDIPAAERPLITVERPPFGPGKWTHVVFTFEHFNTGRPDGVARLYLDGAAAGELTGRQQTFTWDPDRAAIRLGPGYIGMLDEFSVFNRTLNPDEVRALHDLELGVASLLR